MAEIRVLWVAVDQRGAIQATWYRGCYQPHRKWLKAVRSLGWRPIRGTVRFRYGAIAGLDLGLAAADVSVK